MVLYNLKIMDFTFKTLSEIVGPNQNIDGLKFDKIIDVYLNNLVKQFQAGDSSYKSHQNIEIKNYKKFYEELTNFDGRIFTDWDCINLKDQDFLIKEIEDIRSIKEDINRINVIYNHDDEDDCYFEYSDDPIYDGDHESFDGIYKKYALYKFNYPKKCVFGQLYSRVKKDNDNAGAASDKYKKSYEYLDFSGYLLYDYVHNYPKYIGKPICNHLNKFLEERILNILNINNEFVDGQFEEFTTFTLYDIIYPNSHYIYNVKDKNFCLPVDRVICHFNENPEIIGTEESLKYENNLTIGNFMQDIFGMSKNSIHKDIQNIFINCLNKKLFKLFTDLRKNNMFYEKKLNFIFTDIIALFAFFVKLNDELRKREKDKKKDNTNILNIEVYKSVSLKIKDKKEKTELLYSDLPFLYYNDDLAQAVLKNVNSLNFIDPGSHLIIPVNHRTDVMTDDFCSECFQNNSYVFENNFIFDVKKDELYKFISDSMIRIGRFGPYLILEGNFTGQACDSNPMNVRNQNILPVGQFYYYKTDFSYYCHPNGTQNNEAKKNLSYVFTERNNVNETIATLISQSQDKTSFYVGLFGLLILQTIYLNTVMSDAAYNMIYQIYNMGIKMGFAQHYIWKYLMDRDKNKILNFCSDDNIEQLSVQDNSHMGINDIMEHLFKSLFLDKETYDSMIYYKIKNFAYEYNDIYIYSSQNYFGSSDRKSRIFSVLLEYYNERLNKKLINFNSNELKIHKKKYRNIEMWQMIKKLIQNKIFLNVENKQNENIPKKKELSEDQKNSMFEIIKTVAKKTKPETIRVNQAIENYGELEGIGEKEPENDDDNVYKDLLKDENASLFKGGQQERKDIYYNLNNDIYSLLLLNYYDNLTIQKLKYYYLFNMLINSIYIGIDIEDDSSYLLPGDNNGINVLFFPNYEKISLFITEELSDDVKLLTKRISYLIYYYFYGINYQFLKTKDRVIGKYLDVAHNGGTFIIHQLIRQFLGIVEDRDITLFKFDIIKKTFDEINDQLPNDIKIKENNNLKQNINNQGQIIMQSNNGIYSLTQMPEITKQNLTEGNNINVSFLNNNGLLPFLLSRNLNKEILKGGDKLFNRAASAFGQIRHMSISDIINLYRKGGNNVLNVEQMTFLKNAERLDKEREEEYNLIIGVINYIRDAIKRENIPEKDLETFDKGLDEMRKTGFKAAKTIELQNLHKQKGGKDIPDILTKLKQGQYRRQQIDNNYIEELNNYLKSF